MTVLPEDPMILFSFINTKLRDNYASLDELCDDMDISKADLVAKLGSVGFEYNPQQNKFLVSSIWFSGCEAMVRLPCRRCFVGIKRRCAV